MDEEQIKNLEFWINDAYKAINQDRHQYCINNDIENRDYYPFLAGELKAHIRTLKEIIERR